MVIFQIENELKKYLIANFFEFSDKEFILMNTMHFENNFHIK